MQPQNKNQVPLKIKFPFTKNTQNVQKDHSRQRINKSVSCMKRKYEKVLVENDNLQKNVWRLQKKVQKSSKIASPGQSSTFDDCNKATPVKTAEKIIRESGLTPRKVPKVKKALIVHNVMLKGLQKSKIGRKYILQASNQQLRSQRCNRVLARTLNVGRNWYREKAKKIKTKAAMKSEMLRRKVVVFLKRPDNSTCLPGKKDKLKCGKKTEQKYILTDTLKNLHSKFKLENPTTAMSLAAFCKLRPKYMLTVRFTNRKVCLCQKHQNMALKLQALKKHHLEGLPVHPDALSELSVDTTEEKLQNLDHENITYREWPKTEVPYKDKLVKKTTLKEVTEAKASFIDKFVREMKAFQAHVKRVKTQYEQTRLLKQNLPDSHVTVQVDFAENYACNYAEEVQSAYYSKQQVTIHPAVMHFGNATEESPQSHKSFAIISDETAHTSGTVYYTRS